MIFFVSDSAASLLGVPDPSNPNAPVAPAPKLTAKQLCRALLASPQYRESLLRRMLMDDLPPAIEIRLWDIAEGKPVERIDVKERVEGLEDLTPEVVTKKLERVQRMLTLLKNARANDIDDVENQTSVH